MAIKPFEQLNFFKIALSLFLGISRYEVQKTANMPQGEVDNALEWLSNEGHVYSTMDEDHFKTTDS